MRKGFLFDSNRCVGCGACKAGCFNENGWLISVREIYTGCIAYPGSRTLSILSLACNHCETAVCLEGCPASCYTRDESTGAVIINENKCLGCKYCKWNCPYDAPKFDADRKIILKCNFCVARLNNGSSPACSLACPTGALSWGEIKSYTGCASLNWFPDKELNPAIELISNQGKNGVKIIPQESFDNPVTLTETRKNLGDEISLVVFTFLTTLAVSFVGSSLMKGFFPGILAIGPMLLLAMISSLFHLGKWSRAWRACSNLRQSPLSREILLFILFSALSLSASIFRIPVLMPVSAITGLVLLITIDRVYTFSDTRKVVYMHSGQTFPGALMIISFASGMLIPFIFIALIRIAFSFYLNRARQKTGNFQLLRFFRIAALLLAGASMIRGNNNNEGMIMGLLLIGELIDRLLFYADFSPLNIKTSENLNIIVSKNEK
jgi:Fe-S-cluster-containing dehydrogenase component/DMSO reductase anchor subunit